MQAASHDGQDPIAAAQSRRCPAQKKNGPQPKKAAGHGLRTGTPMRGRGLGWLALADHVLQEVDAAVAVTPLVVVPGDQLEEVRIQLQRAAGVVDARTLVVD